MPDREKNRQKSGAAAGRAARPFLRCLAAALALLLTAAAFLPSSAGETVRERNAAVHGPRMNGARLDKSIKESFAEKMGGEEKPAESEDSEEARAYAEAAELLRAGRPGAAALAFRALGSYRNAAELSAECWRLARLRLSIAAGVNHTLGIKADGSGAACGKLKEDKCNVFLWKDLVAVAAGTDHSVGLKADGTLVSRGSNSSGERSLKDWTDVVAIAASEKHTIGLRADGTVLAGGKNGFGEREVSGWSDIVAVAAGTQHTLGLKADGTVLAIGYNSDGECEVSDWTEVVSIAAGPWTSYGVRADGTVLATGWNDVGQCEVSDWTDIVQVAAGKRHAVGLKADGTVVTVGKDSSGCCSKTKDWTDIVQICAGEEYTVGLRSDGTVAAVGYNEFGMCDARSWKGMLVPPSFEDELAGLQIMTEEPPEAEPEEQPAEPEEKETPPETDQEETPPAAEAKQEPTSAPDDAGLAGTYRCFAMAEGKRCVAVSGEDADRNLFLLRGDGTGVFTNKGTETAFRWTQEGDEILLSSKNGKVSYAQMLTLRLDRGVLVLVISPELMGGTESGTNYYAKPGTDTSFVRTDG